MIAAAFDALPIGVLILDRDRRIRAWNRWLAEQTGIATLDAVGHSLDDLYPDLRNPRFLMAVDQAFRQGGPQILSQALHRHLIPIPMPHLARHGIEHMRQHVHIEAIADDAETVAVVSIIDVTDSVLRTEALTDMARRLEHDVNRDPLTNLFNRRFMWEWLEHQYKQAQRYGYPIAALMVDLDHFKRINDQFGHAVGDSLLQDFAGRLADWVREADIVVRYGGEEFLVLLPRCDQALAQEVGARIVAQTRRIELLGGDRRAITCSIGIAITGPEAWLPPADLLGEADRRLYLAKCEGRDRVVATG